MSDINGNGSVSGNGWTVTCNMWGTTTTTQTTQVDIDTGNFVIIKSTHNQPEAPSGAPASYTYISVGGQLPVLLNNLLSALSTWSINFSNASGIFDASYDIWLNGSEGTHELMIWLAYQGGCQPAGSLIDHALINGVNYAIYYSKNGLGSGGYDTLTYMSLPTNQTSVVFDLNAFFQDAINRGYLNGADSLTSVLAGFEIWTDGVNLASSGYSLVISTVQGGCFIATAAYGSPLARELDVFRRFRDKRLPRKLTLTYYYLSSPCAYWLSLHRRLKTAVRWILDFVRLWLR